MERLSSPLEDLRDCYDVIVIGSGYGGSVAASRLARAGRSVCVLERGLERHPGEYPETFLDAACDIQIDTPRAHFWSETALFDYRINRDLNVLVGCGLGGTSLINAGVSLAPDPRVLDDPGWPAALRNGDDALLADAFKRATEMLQPVTYPAAAPPLGKLAAHERAAATMRLPFRRVPINVTFSERINHAGVLQQACTLCGNCVTGCNESAKNTTLMNYLPDARRHGTHVFVGTNVRDVAREGDRWAVHFRTAKGGRERFGGPLLCARADVVVLAAGTLGSTEILLRSRAGGLPLSQSLGTRFSGNGDVLRFAYGTSSRIDGMSARSSDPSNRALVGPCITSAIDLRGTNDADDGLLIEEGTVPQALAHLLGLPFAIAADANVPDDDVRLFDIARRKVAEAHSALRGPDAGILVHTQTFLVMGHDGSDGRLHIVNDRLRVEWPGVGAHRVFSRVEEQLERTSTVMGGVLLDNPTRWSPLGRGLVTVHPLGGCSMDDDAAAGVVNHKGQVYSGEGAAVHPGLYVMDGAVIPRSLGVNPLLTITALAERNCALLAKERGWRIDYSSRAPAARPRAARARLEFNERMSGFLSTVDFDDHERAARRGELDDSTCEVVLTIAISDLEKTLADPAHTAKLFGTVRISALSPQVMSVHSGEFNLFVEDDGEIHTHRMLYRMRAQATDGRLFHLTGEKRIRDACLADLWPATTTLFVDVHGEGDASAPLIGRAILRIAPADFARQLSTLTVRDAGSALAAARLLGDFGRLFAGRLWEHFGGALATNPVPGERAVVRQKRELNAPQPDVHFFETADGVALRLVRYNGGRKGPLVCAPGFSNTSQVFAWDGVETNWVEFFTAHGYDVWLFDYRASPDLPASRTQFTLDQIALHDWPRAIDYVRRVTGAESLQALGHCLGSATGFMSLLAGRMTAVRQFVGSQVMPFVEVSKLAKLKARVRLDRVFALLGIEGVETDAGRSTRDKAVDELLRFSPMPREWQTLGPVCRRIYAIYGPVMKPDHINRETRDALDWIFGYGNVTSFGQIRQFIRRERLVDAQGADAYLPHVDRLHAHVVLLQGGDNELFLPQGSAVTLEWLRSHRGDGAGTRVVVPGYAHLDCFIGRDAARDVFPLVLEQLEIFN